MVPASATHPVLPFRIAPAAPLSIRTIPIKWYNSYYIIHRLLEDEEKDTL